MKKKIDGSYNTEYAARMPYLLLTTADKKSLYEMAKMAKQSISAISIIPLFLGSILMLVAGSGLVSTKYPFYAGLVCYVIFALIEIVSRLKIRG